MKKAPTQSETLLKAVFDFTGVALGTTDRDGRWLNINAAFSRLLGYTQEELSGLTNRDLTHPNDRDLTERYMTDIAEGKIDSYRTEKRYIHKNGDTVWGDVSLTAIRDRDRNLVTLVGAVMDITERKRAEERLLTSQQMEAIGMLARGIAHEFNNALATILGYASFLKGKATKDDVFFNGLTAIEESAVRASELTSQIHAYSRAAKIEIGTFSINRAVGDVHKLIQKTFNKSIRIVLDLDENINSIDADIAQIKLMVLNLCINARDVMPRGGVLTIRTFMSCVPDDRIGFNEAIPPGEYVSITVSDTGSGLDEEAIKRTFESYCSGETGSEPAGFGLPIVYGIVKRHNGWIDVTSRVGSGTEFSILLPTSEKKEDAPVAKSIGALGGSETILVIDDETQIVKMLDQLLKDFGYQVLYAYSGADGIRIFEKKGKEIDLVLLDIMMPGMGGEQVLERLLRLRPDVKVLMASGFSDKERREDLMAMGAAGFIGKPFNVRGLVGTIRNILGY